MNLFKKIAAAVAIGVIYIGAVVAVCYAIYGALNE